MTTQFDWHDLSDAIESAWPVSRFRDVGVIVGCSGGADSVALLRCLVDLVRRESHPTPSRGFVIAAHFDHGFRGSESNGDADFVTQLATDLGIPLEIARGRARKNDEESARDDRREFFRRVVRKRGARYLALGHSLDDNVETVLYRLMRGTGPTGIAGIAPFRPLSHCQQGSDFIVARPMLGIGRRSIREALRSREFRWREDTSNEQNEYRRNWIRNELVPVIESQFPDAVSAIARAIEGQRQWQTALAPCVDQWIDANVIQSNPLAIRRLDGVNAGANGLIDRNPADGQAIAVEALRQIWLQSGWPLQAMDQSHWNRLCETLAGRGPDAMMLPGAIQVRRDDQATTLIREA